VPHSSHTRKEFLIAAVLLAALVLGNMIGFWFFTRHGASSSQYGGKVMALSDHAITIVDTRGTYRVFTIASSTRIVVGRNVTPETDVAVGSFVMVSAPAVESAATATSIRILSTDFFTHTGKPVTP
jgi:hypothetical protein